MNEPEVYDFKDLSCEDLAELDGKSYYLSDEADERFTQLENELEEMEKERDEAQAEVEEVEELEDKSVDISAILIDKMNYLVYEKHAEQL